MQEAAPERMPGEDPADFIQRVTDYLAEPDRRRLGAYTQAQVDHAVDELQMDRRTTSPTPWGAALVAILGGIIIGRKTKKGA